MANEINLSNLDRKTIKELQIITVMTLNDVCQQTNRINGTVAQHERRLQELEQDRYASKEFRNDRRRRADKKLLWIAGILIPVLIAIGGIISQLFSGILTK